MKLQQRTGQIEVSIQLDVPQMVASCNHVILDFCNALWRGRAFTMTEKGSVFFFDPVAADKTLEGETMAESLSLYRHFAFLGFAVKFIDEKVSFV